MNSRWRLVTLLGVVVAIQVGIGTWYWIRTADDRATLQREDGALAAYKAAGLPWEAGDLSKQNVGAPDPSKDLPGTKIGRKDIEDELDRIKILISKGKLKDAALAMAPFAKDLSIAEAVSNLPKIDFHFDYDQGGMMLVGQIYSLRDLAAIAATQARLDASSGDINSCCRHLQASWRLAKLLDSQPVDLASLWEEGVEISTFRSLEISAYCFRNSKKALEALGRSVDFRKSLPDFRRAAEARAYLEISMLRNPGLFVGPTTDGDAEAPALDPKKIVHTGFPKGLSDRASMVRLLELWTIAVKASDSFSNDPTKLSKKIEVDQTEWEKAHHEHHEYQDDSELYPSMDSIVNEALKAEAHGVVTEAYLELLKSKVDHPGVDPELSRIAASFVDPFTQKPLKFKLTKGGFRVYSLGPSLKDVGGFVAAYEEPPGSPHTTPSNITAAYPPLMPKSKR